MKDIKRNIKLKNQGYIFTVILMATISLKLEAKPVKIVVDLFT